MQDGAFRADLVLNGPPVADALSLLGPWERTGTYRVVVKKPGYETWTRENVRVTKDRCHVRTQNLEARLQPQS